MKPWVKATSSGKLYVDTSHPEWQKWFISEIKRLQKYDFVKEIRLKQNQQQPQPE